MKKTSTAKRIGTDLTRIVSILITDFYNGLTSLTTQDVVRRFCVDTSTAQRVLQILQVVTTYDHDTFLPLVLKNNSTLMLAGDLDGYHKNRRPYLSETEIIALLNALNQAGIREDSAFQSLLLTYTEPSISHDTLSQLVPETQSCHIGSILKKTTLACLTRKRIEFSYTNADGVSKNYTIDPYFILHQHEHWYLIGWDITADQQKTFMQDKISNLVLSPEDFTDHDIQTDNAFTFNSVERVRVSFLNPDLFDADTWIGGEVISRTEKLLEISVPYFGGMWLAKEIAGLGNQVTTDNPKINQKVKEWSEELLRELQKKTDGYRG